MICVRATKGEKDRITLFPVSLKQDLQDQLEKVKHMHDEDLAAGCGILKRVGPHTFRHCFATHLKDCGG